MILVTGGLGLIGSAVVEELSKIDRNYKIIDLPEHNIIYHKECEEIFSKYRPTEVIHCAAISHIPDAIGNPQKAFEVNVVGTWNLLQAARDYKVDKFILVSSTSTYGDFEGNVVTEEYPLSPKNYYGSTKACCEFLARSYYSTFKVPTCVVKTSSVYGPGEKHPRVVKNFVERALKHETLKVEGGVQRRAFTYVKDVVNGIMLALLSDKSVGEVFNITGDAEHSIVELAEVVNSFLPCGIHITGNRSDDLKRGRVSCQKAYDILGYRAEYSLESGIKEYIEWIKQLSSTE